MQTNGYGPHTRDLLLMKRQHTMSNNYQHLTRKGMHLLLLLGLWLSGAAVQAQSGPVGNEWIVPGQQYFKVKILKDGLYRLNYQYLTQAGIAGVAPEQLQLWRRGREMARYIGGNKAVLDPTTFLEFYGVHNDGKLDGELYKQPQDQPHQLFDFYTDTASYFITWGVGAAARPGRPMPQPVASGGVPHPYRQAVHLYLHTDDFKVRNLSHPNPYIYLPWVEPGEGFFWIQTTNYTTSDGAAGIADPLATDSVFRSISASGPAPTVEVLLSGATETQHVTEVLVVPPTGPARTLGVIRYSGFQRGRQTFPVLRSDINSSGKNAGRVVIQVRNLAPAIDRDFFHLCYVRVIAPQMNEWFADRNLLAFQNDSLLGGPATYELEAVPATVAGFDVQDFYNVQRIVGTPGAGTTRRFVFPGATASATHKLLLADESRPLVPPVPARRVRFRQLNPAGPNFIIITHPQLMKPAAGVPNAALAYASYRANPGPGLTRYDTLMVTTNQLYDQFHYGDRSWLALRHFARWMAAASPAGATRYLLLLGKGIVSEEKLAGQHIRKAGEKGLDLVPTSTRSVSDNLLTADYANDNFVAKLATSRLTVTTPQQVMNYLEKLRTHEELGRLPVQAPWRKNVLHLAGGYTSSETADFRAILDAGKVRIERPLLGGKVTTESRITPDRFPVSIDISAQLNAGLSLISYLGHASNNTFGLNFGTPSTTLNYNNTGRYPMLFLSGCGANHTFTAAPTVVEDWLFTEKKGALGSLGESGFSFAHDLKVSHDTLYKLLFNDPAWYGKPITVVQNEVVRRLQGTAYFNTGNGVEQLLATGWQGDPTLALYAPAKPDFIASTATLSVTPTGSAPIRADSPDFVLNVGVANPAKITIDSVQIQVTRTFSSGRASQVMRFTYRQAWSADTTYALTIPNPSGPGVVGTSTFRVVLDPNNKVAELDETNNTAEIDFSFLEGGVSIITPTEFAISTTTQPRLLVQSNNPLGAERDYDFEIDTVATFTGMVQRSVVRAGILAEWQPTLPATLGRRDSIVWYWRARFRTPGAGEDGRWVTSSFRVIPGSPGGWSQSHYTQLQRTTHTGLSVSGPAGRWAFVERKVPLVLRTRGGGAPRSLPTFGSLTGAGIYIQSAAGPPSVGGCGVQSPNLLIAVYNPTSLRPVAMPSHFQRCGQAPDYFYYFSTTDPPRSGFPLDTLDNLNYSPIRQQELESFLSAIPVGSYVAVVSANRLRYTLLPVALKARLQALLGSQLITQLADGEPLALLGQKLSATTGRLVHETGPNRNPWLGLPHLQGVELRDTLRQPNSAGRIVSPRIGPAKEWLNLYSTIKKTTPASYHTLSVVGINAAGLETVVLANVTSSAQPLTALVPAATYPYLRLELAVADTVTRVPPQLRQWLVTSRGVPEGVVRRDQVAAADYAPAKLANQAVTTGFIEFPVKFQNVSDEPFTAPLSTLIKLRNVTSGTVVATALLPAPALLPNTTLTLPVRLDVRDKFGTFATEVVVNPPGPLRQPEQNYTNNELTLDPFTVVDTNVPPTLDVAFDGRHILNGELVSPRPLISIQLRDESKLRHISNRTVFTVSLLKGQTGVPTLVDLNGPAVNFSVDSTTDVNGSVAKLEYRPGLSAPLADGEYTLRVQGRDPSNANAGSQDFQVKFEVVNESQITNLYPYPNPVVSKTRFVFTVTGQELPRNMKIQILTITGRVVREIFMSELGPLHIGNNLTDFAWDGTDSFGDRLANGTYLYRVLLDDAGGQFKHRDSGGDIGKKAFKNDWGKLVLMR